MTENITFSIVTVLGKTLFFRKPTSPENNAAWRNPVSSFQICIEYAALSSYIL